VPQCKSLFFSPGKLFGRPPFYPALILATFINFCSGSRRSTLDVVPSLIPIYQIEFICEFCFIIAFFIIAFHAHFPLSFSGARAPLDNPRSISCQAARCRSGSSISCHSPSPSPFPRPYPTRRRRCCAVADLSSDRRTRPACPLADEARPSMGSELRCGSGYPSFGDPKVTHPPPPGRYCGCEVRQRADQRCDLSLSLSPSLPPSPSLSLSLPLLSLSLWNPARGFPAARRLARRPAGQGGIALALSLPSPHGSAAVLRNV
jgi:hypothetical protein